MSKAQLVPGLECLTPGSAKFKNALKICSTPRLTKRKNAPQPCDGEGLGGGGGGGGGLGAAGIDLCLFYLDITICQTDDCF